MFVYVILFLHKNTVCLPGYYSSTSNPVLLYSTASDIRVANISKLGKINSIIKGLEQGSAVDFLCKSNLVCWSDQTAELIQCMEYNETHSGEKVYILCIILKFL